MGYANDFEEVKSQPFFSKIKWNQLLKKTRYGPLKPHLSGYYFDKEFVENLTESDAKEMSLDWVADRHELQKQHT